MIAQSLRPVIAASIIGNWVDVLTSGHSEPLLTTPTVHLYSAVSQSLLPGMSVSAFTECTFTGYASALLTLTSPLNLGSSVGLGAGGGVNFVASAQVAGGGQNALGYWVDDGTAMFYLAEAFPSPISFVNAFDFLDLFVIFGAIYNPTVN